MVKPKLGSVCENTLCKHKQWKIDAITAGYIIVVQVILL